VTVTETSTLEQVALAVGAQLTRCGIRAVLTGGACVAIYTGTYVSKDADFVVQSRVRQAELDEALAHLGFGRQAERYVHSASPFYVEFPPGPLSIGDDLGIVPVELRVGDTHALALSPTDSCRDRLAAFYHWNDRQALGLAVQIAARQQVDMAVVSAWSESEGMTSKYEEFEREVKRGR
jgi:hypothetical protein